MNIAAESLSRAQRRAIARIERRAQRKPRRPAVSRDDLKMSTIPWNIDQVWRPLEQVIDRMEIDGTTETALGRPVLYDAGTGGWYEIAPAVEGMVDFHRIAAARYGWDVDLRPLEKFAAKMNHGTPIFEADVKAVRDTAVTLKRLVGQITLREAKDILTTVRIQIELDKQS